MTGVVGVDMGAHIYRPSILCEILKYNLIKISVFLAILLISVFRSIFLAGAATTLWNKMFLPCFIFPRISDNSSLCGNDIFLIRLS